MQILSATADAAEWDALWSKLPDDARDVHFTSAYARVQEIMGGKAILAVISSPYGFIMQPFLMQPIEGTHYFDLKSLYGYGGPVTNYKPDMVADLIFRGELFTWADKADVVSEYCALHPLLWKHQIPLVSKESLTFTKDVIVIEDLANFDEKKCRRRVQRALRTAREDLEDDFVVIQSEDPLIFSDLYDQSMDRLHAVDRWRFNVVYWHSHGKKEVGARWFFVVQTHGDEKDIGRFRRALLTIGNGRTAYAHFLGSDGQMLHSGLDQMLYYNAARHLAEEGNERFHLGGGLTERSDDPLLLFKSGFSETRYRVGSYRRIFLPQVYERLVDERGRDESWFPAYRRAIA